jgi:hypothetical protein
MVPSTVDRQALLDRWMAACKDGVASDLSGFIPGADHSVTGVEAQEWVAERVRAFLGRL